jgi:hypothetical protein
LEAIRGGAAYRGDPDCDDDGETWGGFDDPAVYWTVGAGKPVLGNGGQSDLDGPADPDDGPFDLVLKVKDSASDTVKDDGDANGRIQVASIKVYAIKVDVSGNLWWFNGENAANYHESVTLTATGATTGYFKWVVKDDGSRDRVTLNNGGADADQIAVSNDNTVTAKSEGASATNPDTTVSFYFGTNAGNAVLVKDTTGTVWAPHKNVRLPASDTDSPLNNGYLSEIYYKTVDQFGVVLPANVELNEDFYYSSDQ